MTLNIIHLPHRLDRYGHLVDQLISQNIIDYKIHEGIICEPVCTGISRSFKKIVQDAKEKELEMVTIGEDDILFTAPGAWQYFLDNIPPYFDMYIASYYSGLETYNHRIEDFRGLTLSIIHSKFFDKFLSMPEDKNLDHALSFKGEYFVSPLFPAIQCAGYSDQMKKYVDYTNKMPEHKLFRGR